MGAPVATDSGASPSGGVPFPITVRIPLHAQDGSVRAWTSIDAADWPWAKQYRWYFSDGYVRRRQGRKQPRMARELMGLTEGDPRRADHEDRGTLNNRRSNLRVVTHRENCQNKGKQRGNWSSQYRGVSWRPTQGKWCAYARVNGEFINGGYHDTEERAAEVAAALRSEHFTHSTD